METTLLITLLLTITGGILIFIMNDKKQMKELKTQEVANEIKAKLAKNKGVKTSDLMTKSNQNNGIINREVTKENKEKSNKPIAWKEIDSYEEKEKEVNSKDYEPITFKVQENSKELVLLVDDSLVVRKFVGDILKNAGYDVVLKNDGWEAITFLNSDSLKPDFIISDIEMPHMNGFQLIEAIRKEKKFKNVPILVISAHAANHLELMESEKIQGFIKKPFEQDDLINQINFIKSNM
jgi:CheY-like chemotaxis protein